MSGEFQFHDELASLFAQRPAAAGTMMQLQEQQAEPAASWFAEYLQAGTPMAMDYDVLCRALELPVVEDVVKREQLQLVDSAGRCKKEEGDGEDGKGEEEDGDKSKKG